MLYIHYCVIFALCSYYFSSLSVRRRQASYQFNRPGIAGFASNSGTPSVQHAATTLATMDLLPISRTSRFAFVVVPQVVQ